MTHLTESQFVDVLEGRAEPLGRIADHLATCPACQAELASLGEVLGMARSIDLPEPSPLFWDHFSRRVRAATNAEGVPVPAIRWSGVRVWQPALALAAAAAVLAVLVLGRPHHGASRLSTDGTVAVATDDPATGLTTGSTGPLDEAGLNVMTVLAQDLRTDDLQQIAQPTSDATGAAIEDLTPAQCEQLVRLIRAQSGAE